MMEYEDPKCCNDYKEQANDILNDLRNHYIMLQRPTWFTLPLMMPFIMSACALAAILANCYIEPSTIVTGVIEQVETVQGLRFRIEMYELYGSAVVTLLLAYTQCASSSNNAYFALPWIGWTLLGMVFKEIPGLYITCYRILRLSISHGIILAMAAGILIYMQYRLVSIIWRKNKLELGKAIVKNMMNLENSSCKFL